MILVGPSAAWSSATYRLDNGGGLQTGTNNSASGTPAGPANAPVVQFAQPDARLVPVLGAAQMAGTDMTSGNAASPLDPTPLSGGGSGGAGAAPAADGGAFASSLTPGPAANGAAGLGANAPVPVNVSAQVVTVNGKWMRSTLVASHVTIDTSVGHQNITVLNWDKGQGMDVVAGIRTREDMNFGIAAWNALRPVMKLAEYVGGANIERTVQGLLSLADPTGGVAIVGQHQEFHSSSSDPYVQWVDKMLYNNGQPLTAGSAPIYGTYWNGQGNSAQEALSMAAPFVSAGVFLVAGMWMAGTTALLGATGSAVGAMTGGMIGAVPGLLAGDAAAIAGGFAEGFFFGAMTPPGAGSNAPVRGPLNFGYTGAGMVGKQAKATANRALRKAERLAMRGGGNAAKAGEKCFAKISNACFTGRLLIDVADGKKQAKDIQLGDLVASRSEFDPVGLIEYKEVEEVFVRVSPILNVHVAGQEIEATPEHPFYVEGRGWIPAKELQIGDLLLTGDDDFVPVAGVADSGQVVTVYNWRINDFHTLFVSATKQGVSVWAHNTDYKVPKKGGKGKAGATNIPSWVKDKPKVGQSATDFATKVLDDKYGKGNWSKGAGTEFNQIKKWVERHFERDVKLPPPPKPPRPQT